MVKKNHKFFRQVFSDCYRPNYEGNLQHVRILFFWSTHDRHLTLESFHCCVPNIQGGFGRFQKGMTDQKECFCNDFSDKPNCFVSNRFPSTHKKKRCPTLNSAKSNVKTIGLWDSFFSSQTIPRINHPAGHFENGIHTEYLGLHLGQISSRMLQRTNLKAMNSNKILNRTTTCN